MKKRIWVLLPLCCALLLAAVWARGDRPLEGLTAADVQRVEVELFPSGPAGPELVLTREEIEQLVPLLGRVTTHQRDDSWGEYTGGCEIFRITLTDGGRLEAIDGGNLFFILDGDCRRADYGPLSELCGFVRGLRA